jgi:hypothetical protein
MSQEQTQAIAVYKGDWKRRRNEEPAFHDAQLQQKAAYNHLPEVMERETDRRRGPIGAPMQVINSAIQSVRARCATLFSIS